MAESKMMEFDNGIQRKKKYKTPLADTIVETVDDVMNFFTSEPEAKSYHEGSNNSYEQELRKKTGRYAPNQNKR
jgi:hypothetical protein